MITTTTTGTPPQGAPGTLRSTAPTRRGAHLAAAAVDRLRSRRRVSLLVAALAVGAAGAWFAAVMPRGPVASGDVVWAAALPLLAGLAAGWLTGSRWAIVASPAWFAVVAELVRATDVGPSVDWPRFDSLVGVIVAVTSRGLHAWLVLVPLALGAAVGAGIARRSEGVSPGTGAGRFWRGVRRGVAVVVAVLLVGSVAVLTRPGSTPPIVDAQGREVPGSIAELARVTLGGQEQTVLIRGRSTAAPVLLYLSGGPGQSDLGYVRSYLPRLEDDVVLAVWDQRGSGTSYSALEPAATWTLSQAVSDTIDLATYLRDRFGGRKVILFGNSWGSILGVLAVQQRPDLFAAYVGAGQMVDVLETDTRLNADMRALARSRGDSALLAEIDGWGPPPYADVYPNARLIEFYDDIEPYERSESFLAGRPSGIDGNGAPEYGWLDKVNKLRAIADMGAVMYPQVQGLDFRRDVRSIDVPVYLVAGKHELSARADLAREWFDRLQAPRKQWLVFSESGHVPQFEEAAHFQRVIADVVSAGTP